MLLGVLRGDEDEARRLAERTARYRVFPDAEGRIDRSLLDVRAARSVVSQFTLAADGRRGRRPSFDRAAAPGTRGAPVQQLHGRPRGPASPSRRASSAR
ncbi:MAG: D-aminoacyl-tRNA deacylase [Planctomycetota bacterium]